MQTQKFKKRILMESGIFAAIILVIGGATYFLDMVSTDYNESNSLIKNKVSTIQSDLSSLQQKYSFITHNSNIYNEIKKKQADGKLSITRQLIFEKFNQFRSQYDLSNLRLSVSPVQETKNAKLKRKTSVVNSSDVNVEMEVLYDENVYELLNAIQRELSGICAVSRLTMIIQKPVDANVLRTIGEKGTYPLIKTAIQFNWYSINPVESSDAGDAAKK